MHELEDLLTKTAMLSTLIYRFNIGPTKIPGRFFCRNWQAHHKIQMEMQGTRIAKTILKKNKCGAFTLPSLKTYYKATIIKTVWYWHKVRQIKGKELRVQKWTVKVNWFSKRVPGCFNGGRIAFLTNGVGTTGYLNAKDEVGLLPRTTYKN